MKVYEDNRQREIEESKLNEINGGGGKYNPNMPITPF